MSSAPTSFWYRPTHDTSDRFAFFHSRSAFVFQAWFRHMVFDTWLLASLAPLSGVAYVLFTFYMVPDPGTTPSTTRGQIVFGASVGLLYGVFMALHVVFAVFIALFVVCLCRGAILHVLALPWVAAWHTPVTAPVPTLAQSPQQSGPSIGV